PPSTARWSGDGHRVARGARGAGEAHRIERVNELVDLVLHEAVQIQVLVDVDPVHSDPDDVALERTVRVLARHRLDRPGVGAHDHDALPDEPVGHGLTGAGATLVVLGIVLLPQLAVAGVEEHHVTRARLPRPLLLGGFRYVLHGGARRARPP